MMFLNQKGEAVTPDLAQLMSSAFSQHGVGVFETLRYTRWDVENAEAHYQRMKQSGAVLNLSLAVPLERLLEVSGTLMQKPSGVVKWRLILIGDQSFVCVTVSDMPYTPEHYQKGVCIGVSRCKKCEVSVVNKLKTINYLENRLERESGKQSGFWDVLFTNTHDYVTECTASNVFFIKDGVIYTPDPSCGLLEGTMRRKVIHFLKSKGYAVKEGHYLLSALLEADEVFITNALMGVMPVWGIDCGGGAVRLPKFKSEFMCVLIQTFSIQEI